MPGVVSRVEFVLIAADEELLPVVSYYWGLGLNDKKIVEHMLDHFDQSLYGLRWASVFLYM
jgi:hypothetical protein